MPSAATNAVASLPFAPTQAALEEAIALLEERGERAGGAVDADARREAFARYETLPAPGGRPSRGWRHDYDKLALEGLGWTSDRMAVETVPLASAPPSATADAEIDRPALATENAGGLVHLGPTVLTPRAGAERDSAAATGLVVVPLADALHSHGELVARATAESEARRADRFAALATAFQNCGAFVYVPEGVVLDAPIQLVFANGAAHDIAVFPRIVVVLGAGARATVLERHVGEGDAFVCGTVDVLAEEGAQLEYAAVQRAAEGARLAFWRGARVGPNARIRWSVAELGGMLARSVLTASLEAPGAAADLSALFFNTGLQHVDLATVVDHRAGNTPSTTVVRSAATDRGQGRYVGNIAIRPHAHGADASLRDDALLLSKRAHIDSIPALEIAANDVRAFHGATVGSLDEDALFYAASRGIARTDALRMVTLGFFEPAIARFPGEALRDEVRTALDGKIDDATEIDA